MDSDKSSDKYPTSDTPWESVTLGLVHRHSLETDVLFRQQEREQAELQRIAEKRRKEKIADAEARARVKKQIEDDRRARNAKYDEKHEAEMKAKQAELDEIKGIFSDSCITAFSMQH